ncbi:MAG: hypothetical protein PHQ96_01530 [Candidatus Omnitrophica bacterium]|nr:hypothetical protein [Candidatus Omnitrophota bacterium]
MDKNEALEDFLKSLRVALNHASVYFKEHPLFINAINDLRVKIINVSSFVKPLRIGVAPFSLVIAGESFANARVHKELSEIFHCRKIKRIEIQSGISAQELAVFIYVLSLPSREVFANGGLGRIIKKQALTSVNIEELDYFQLLTGEGQEYKDVWTFLLGSVVKEDKPEEIKEFTENFGKILSKFRNQDFLENETLRENILNFLNYLHLKNKEGFHSCARELTKAILRDKSLVEEEKLNKLKILLKDLDEEDLAQTLWDNILIDEDFDVFSFSLFSRLIDKEKQDRISACLVDKGKQGASVKFSPKIQKKLHDLFAKASTPFILEAYRRTFSPLLHTMEFASDEFLFNREALKKNYRTVLLNLFAELKNNVKMDMVAKRIIAELDVLSHEEDFPYLEALLELTAKAKKENPGAQEHFETIERHAFRLIEDWILKGGQLPDEHFFIEILQKSYYSHEFYLNAIFSEEKYSASVLELFFKFFPAELDVFKRRLKEKEDNASFLRKIIESLGKIDSRLSFEVLEYVFNSFSNFFKIESLKSMQSLSLVDENFLYSVLRKGDNFTRLEAAQALCRDKRKRIAVATTLLGVFNFFGISNNIVRENIKIIEDMDLREARDCLKSFMKRSFWNIPIKRCAQDLLLKWENKVESSSPAAAGEVSPTAEK